MSDTVAQTRDQWREALRPYEIGFGPFVARRLLGYDYEGPLNPATPVQVLQRSGIGFEQGDEQDLLGEVRIPIRYMMVLNTIWRLMFAQSEHPVLQALAFAIMRMPRSLADNINPTVMPGDPDTGTQDQVLVFPPAALRASYSSLICRYVGNYLWLSSQYLRGAATGYRNNMDLGLHEDYMGGDRHESTRGSIACTFDAEDCRRLRKTGQIVKPKLSTWRAIQRDIFPIVSPLWHSDRPMDKSLPGFWEKRPRSRKFVTGMTSLSYYALQSVGPLVTHYCGTLLSYPCKPLIESTVAGMIRDFKRTRQRFGIKAAAEASNVRLAMDYFDACAFSMMLAPSISKHTRSFTTHPIGMSEAIVLESFDYSTLANGCMTNKPWAERFGTQDGWRAHLERLDKSITEAH